MIVPIALGRHRLLRLETLPCTNEVTRFPVVFMRAGVARGMRMDLPIGATEGYRGLL